jgi:PAS domain S-box-containing protein
MALGKVQFTRKRVMLSFLPILIGLGGVIFSWQLERLPVRVLVLSMSVAVPLFVGGHLLARYKTGGLERIFLLAGLLMLLGGAAFSASGIQETLQSADIMPDAVAYISRAIGLFSLVLGLFTVLFVLIRTGENIEELGERFWHLAEHISEGFVLSRPDGTIFLVNNQFLEMFDISREQVVGRKSTEIASMLNLGELRRQIENRSKGIASEYEITWKVRGQERRFWFNGTPIYDNNGTFAAILATVRDITEHHRLSRRVEEYARKLKGLVDEQTRKLAQTEERFRQLLLSMNEGFLTIDANNRIRFANQRIGELLGVDQETIIGRDLFDFVNAPGRMRLLTLLAQGASLQRSRARQELNFINAQGAYVPVLAGVAYIRSDSGEQEKTTGGVYSLVVTGVAELKAMQHKLEERARELEKLNEELRMHDRARDSFLSNVSHELRTPLSTVQGYVEMLESGSLGELEGPQQAAIQVMERNLRRLSGLIGEMIEFSRMEIRGVQLNSNLFSPGRLVNEAVASIQPQTLARDITVDVSAPETVCFAWGDQEKLAQVLGILLNNAVKFTDSGGMIQVHIAIREGDTLELAVADTGIGIDPVYHEKVFAKFFQVDSSKTRRYEGTGIGLSIARSIIDAHGGTISLESAEGEGATFRIALPGALFDSAPEAGTEGMDGMHILVIDESEDFPDAFRALFEGAGVTVDKAPEGYACVRAAEERRPDLIVLNSMDASLTGLTILGLLRQHIVTSAVPVMVLTGEEPAGLQEAESIWGEIYMLAKPFQAGRFTAVLRRACFGEAVPADGAPHPRRHSRESNPCVLIIDADPGFRHWLETLLYQRQIPCLCTADTAEALKLARQQRPDYIFVDADMPGQHINDELRYLQRDAATRQARLVLMTGFPERVTVLEEVAGILKKPFTAGDFIRWIAIRQQTRETADTGAVS